MRRLPFSLMQKFRLVFLRNSEGVEIKFAEKLNLKEIENDLRDGKIVGVFISKDLPSA